MPFGELRRHDTNGGKLEALTPREHEILIVVADGESPTDIADQLVISRKAVSTHIQHVLSKLGVGTRVQAVSLALRERTTHGSRKTSSHPSSRSLLPSSADV